MGNYSRISAIDSFLNAFDAVRIINLENRNDRRLEISEELSRIGLTIDGNKVAFFTARRFEDGAGFPSVGARGCFDSHLSILRGALESGIGSVLIMEDDAMLPRNAADRMSACLTELESLDWSIFFGGGQVMTNSGSGGVPVRELSPDCPVLTTHFVAFRSPAIQALVPYLEAMAARQPGSPEGGPMHVDGAYSWFRRSHPEFRTWYAEPNLAIQRPSQSDIAASNKWAQLPGFRWFVPWGRRLKGALQRYGQ